MFAGARNKSPQEVVGAMFRGEIGKFALTAVMFAIGVKLFATHFLALLAAYIACFPAYWVVMARASFKRSDEF
jgi:F0F1-type ATP synthase assembly protein I